jgi:hypothetical protein
MENLISFDEFTLNESKRQIRKSNLEDVEKINGGIKYKNEIFANINVPKRYVGKGKYKYRVLAKEGTRVKPINFGDRTKKVERFSMLSKKYWDNIPYYK